MKRNARLLLVILCLFALGCETAQKATTEAGKVIGKTTNVIGGVADGGAEAVKGTETEEENPYGR